MRRQSPFAALILLATTAMSQESRKANHLQHETSPYLLQHAYNPVDWHPWGKAALARSKELDRPIFLSIGYAACHWCHVMEHESFADPEVAKLMNERFVCIKVDREERPDLDEVYMTAVQAMTGRGGWPMSVWLTPDLRPIYAGTYFPPTDRWGTPGFARVLEHVSKLWTERRGELQKVGTEVAELVARNLAPKLEAGEPQVAFTDAAVAASRARFDAEFGGWGTEPKFPHVSELMLLLRHHARTQDATSLQIAEKTLTAMAEGGIYDQIGGGFHRYSTDRRWLVPHFEKMLYDNALLARVYVEAHALTKKPLYARVARETLDYLLREMQHHDGGFFATQDADSEGVEGKFFVWQQAEIEQVLGKAQAALACETYGITAGGNWEHQNVLTMARPERRGTPEIEALRARLLAARRQRIAPATDDKVLAAWNGMAIGAFAYAFQVLGDDRYLAAAQRAGQFVLERMRTKQGRLLRSWRNGEARLMGYLEDYAFVAEGLLVLFESDFSPRWLQGAQALLAIVEQRFRDPQDGSFFFTADDHEVLLARSKSVLESSQPSGVAMAALAFCKLGLLLGDPRLYDLGLQALRANHDWLEKHPSGCPSLLLAVEFHASDPREIVLVGATGPALTKFRTEFPPHRVVIQASQELAALTPLVRDKTKPGVYVCRRGLCEEYR